MKIFIYAFCCLILFGCNKVQTEKHINRWKGTWFILKASDFPEIEGTKKDPIGKLIINDDGFGTLEYDGQIKDLVLITDNKTSNVHNLEFMFYKVGGGVKGSATAGFFGTKNTREFTYNLTVDNYLESTVGEQKTWTLKKK